MKIVMKFGGSSVADAKHIKNVAEILKKYSQRDTVVAVISAMGDTTDLLVELAENSRQGKTREVESLLERLEDRHLTAAKGVTSSAGLRDAAIRDVKPMLESLRLITRSTTLLKEVTARSKDQILSFGERLSTCVVGYAAMNMKLKVKVLTGGEAGIVTDSNFGEAKPLMETSSVMINSKVAPLTKQGIMPLVTGFLGQDQDGVMTTLGRGGSDYTATILASALSADEVWLWTDVDGLMTADPRLVQGAKILREVSLDEAVEMAVLGAKAMHPRALEPIYRSNIPVRVKNTAKPELQGSTIRKIELRRTRDVVKCVAAVKDVGMLTVSGGSMVGAPGTAGTIFSTLARKSVNILMISQSVSESNISMILKRPDLSKAQSVLENEFVGGGVIKSVTSEPKVAVIAAIGAGMKGTPGVASRIFRAIAEKGVNVKMIAQGSSELNISFVVGEAEMRSAVQAIHDEFNLAEEK